MTRIASAFKRLGKVNEAAFIPYLTAGYPSFAITRQLVPVLARQGADLIEIGVPGNPWSHGEGVHDAGQSDAALVDCLGVAVEARRANEIPLVLVCDYEAIERYGIEQFATDAVTSGVDGLLVPGLPPEDASSLRATCEPASLDLILCLTANANDMQAGLVADGANGFVCYFPASIPGAEELIGHLKEHTDLPIVPHFDRLTSAQVAQVSQFASGIAVTGVIARAIQGVPEDDIIPAAAEVVRELKEGTVRG